MGKMSRDKGANFERWVATVLSDAGFPTKRGLGQTRAAGEVPDVDFGGFWPELKNHVRTNPRAAYRQAVKAAGKSGRIPIAICKDMREEPFVQLSLTHFIDLLRGPNDALRKFAETLRFEAGTCFAGTLNHDLRIEIAKRAEEIADALGQK